MFSGIGRRVSSLLGILSPSNDEEVSLKNKGILILMLNFYFPISLTRKECFTTGLSADGFPRTVGRQLQAAFGSPTKFVFSSLRLQDPQLKCSNKMAQF